ncbi:type VI secretion system-associated protein TagF [Roseinatronobacter alkalisoli]|uniref:Type VI secretion system-associated protein TagF n=1 Tax=Roseinatronobacter alkalisoli TaxID=3028235 RepID=A0ABT5TC66_9RHOB|nr:type VI secretion system-associated protein TagF [Roseinatronobacter sp. HJB301]MDD7971941.1 type VI secretion system-associated protein TagF [Roseinatronobacter sp. HJB301]
MNEDKKDPGGRTAADGTPDRVVDGTPMARKPQDGSTAHTPDMVSDMAAVTPPRTLQPQDAPAPEPAAADLVTDTPDPDDGTPADHGPADHDADASEDDQADTPPQDTQSEDTAPGNVGLDDDMQASAAPPAPHPAPRPACTAALFGKLPARGDFIARNMPRPLQRPFEDWLIPLIQETRAELGMNWDATWRSAGPWRFWIGPDVLGGSWQRDLRKPVHDQAGTGGAMTGVLLPSADRHGRDFPLVLLLADRLARLIPPPVTTPPDRGWYDLCEAFLYAARGRADISATEAELDRLPGPILPEGADTMDALLARQALWAQSHETTADGTSMIWLDIAQADHHLAAGSRSYWWQAPSGRAATRALSLAGLPDAGTFAFMLSQGQPDTVAPSS